MNNNFIPTLLNVNEFYHFKYYYIQFVLSGSGLSFLTKLLVVRLN